MFSSLGAIRDTNNQGGSRNDAAPPPSVIAINESNEALVAGLKNMTFDSIIGWKNAKRPRHPRLRLQAATVKSDYESLGLIYTKIAPFHIDVVTGSGAQSCIWVLSCEFKTTDLIPVDHTMRAVNRLPIKIEGAIILRLSGEDDEDEKHECAVIVFINSEVEDFFLSEEAMMQLAIIPRDFPRIGAAKITPADTSDISELSAGADNGICSCPKRTLPPGRPSQLPFIPIPENTPKFEEWCKQRYASSSYNQCPHQHLSEMGDTPPLKIHVDAAKPVVSLKPGFIPLYQYDRVIADLKRDIDMGVLERPPINEPVSWCHKMVISTKHDGDPRRTIDMSPLNRVCKREPHGSKTPFHMARAIPRDTWKTVQDAWNGYRSIPIRAEDRHLTTFMTPIGRLRYARAPQGALCSGDAYNQRFDTVLIDFNNKERCVDDTVFGMTAT